LFERRIKYRSNDTAETLKLLLKVDLKGVRRLPALASTKMSLAELQCASYEVCGCEPLHDLKNLISVLMEELPYQIQDKNSRKALQDFIHLLEGEKVLIRGCDARLNLIKLTVKLGEPQFRGGDKQLDLAYKTCLALTELERLAYQPSEGRCPRDILRMHLQALVFATGYHELFTPLKRPSKERKVFGAPFHAVVNHFPELYRMCSLRSVVAEASERCFHKLR